MAFRDFMKSRIQDRVMQIMDPLRAEALEGAEGDVLEVGFGTGLNLPHYGDRVERLTGLDPLAAQGFAALDERIAGAHFPVERCVLDADGELPFDAGRFDTLVTTWTLCSIPDAARALTEMKRVLKPGGRYVFIEHGRAPHANLVRWQDRINPVWRFICDGCNLNRKIDQLVEEAGFEVSKLDRFRADGPAIAAHMYRGVAIRH